MRGLIRKVMGNGDHMHRVKYFFDCTLRMRTEKYKDIRRSMEKKEIWKDRRVLKTYLVLM